jgi:hypothetical protein
VITDFKEHINTWHFHILQAIFFPLVLVIVFKRSFERMEMKFWKPKEVFGGNWPIHKNLSQFLYRCHGLEDSNEYLQPIFPDLNIE